LPSAVSPTARHQNLAALTGCRRIFSRRSAPTSFSSPPDWRPRVLPSDPPAGLSISIQAPSGFPGHPCPSPSGGVRCPGRPRSSDPGLASRTSLRFLPGTSSAPPSGNRRRLSGSPLGFSGWGHPCGRSNRPAEIPPGFLPALIYMRAGPQQVPFRSFRPGKPGRLSGIRNLRRNP